MDFTIVGIGMGVFCIMGTSEYMRNSKEARRQLVINSNNIM